MMAWQPLLMTAGEAEKVRAQRETDSLLGAALRQQITEL